MSDFRLTGEVFPRVCCLQECPSSRAHMVQLLTVPFLLPACHPNSSYRHLRKALGDPSARLLISSCHSLASSLRTLAGYRSVVIPLARSLSSFCGWKSSLNTSVSQGRLCPAGSPLQVRLTEGPPSFLLSRLSPVSHLSPCFL